MVHVSDSRHAFECSGDRLNDGPKRLVAHRVTAAHPDKRPETALTLFADRCELDTRGEFLADGERCSPNLLQLRSHMLFPLDRRRRLVAYVEKDSADGADLHDRLSKLADEGRIEL